MKTIEINLYRFDELSESAKERARQWWREGGLACDWWDATETDAKEIAALMGLEIDNLYFRGFSSQGDGASFTGRYAYRKGGLKAVKAYAPVDKELHRIAEALQSIQRRSFYRLGARITPGHLSNFYCHENTMDIKVETRNGDWANADTQAEVSACLRDFARWYYRQVEAEYNYLMSDEAVDDAILANEYTFTAEGKRMDG